MTANSSERAEHGASTSSTSSTSGASGESGQSDDALEEVYGEPRLVRVEGADGEPEIAIEGVTPADIVTLTSEGALIEHGHGSQTRLSWDAIETGEEFDHVTADVDVRWPSE